MNGFRRSSANWQSAELASARREDSRPRLLTPPQGSGHRGWRSPAMMEQWEMARAAVREMLRAGP